jgi:hypothetical protein
MAEKMQMHDTLEKKGFIYLNDLIRQSVMSPPDSGSCPSNPVGCIAFAKPCRLPFKIF